MYTDTSKLSGPKPSFYCRQRSNWTFWTVAQTIHNCLLLLPGHFYISQLKFTLSEMVKAFDPGYSYVRGVIILTDPNYTFVCITLKYHWPWQNYDILIRRSTREICALTRVYITLTKLHRPMLSSSK